MKKMRQDLSKRPVFESFYLVLITHSDDLLLAFVSADGCWAGAGVCVYGCGCSQTAAGGDWPTCCFH
jgi:hypothetical protein